MVQKKTRLDQLLLAQGICTSIKEAEALILAGKIRVDGVLARHAGERLLATVKLERIADRAYVSRGALKLKGAFEQFPITVKEKICADIGASTGGFSEVLLEQGAKRVYAIDVGYGDLAWKLRNDARVEVIERTNARNLENLPEPVQVICADVSFISLRLILPRAKTWLSQDLDNCDLIVLLKPQFEAEKELVPSGGVIEDAQVHRRVINSFMSWCNSEDLACHGLMCSVIRGSEGNKEFLIWLKPGLLNSIDVELAIQNALSEA